MEDSRISIEGLREILTELKAGEYISLEKFPQQAFFRKYTTWRRGFAPSQIVNTSDRHFQLPDNSVVHFVSDFLHPNPNATVDPDLSMPFVLHESWRKFYGISYNIPKPSDPLFPVTDLHTFQAGPAVAALIKYYNTHPGIRRIMSDDSVGKQKQALIMYDYGVLHRTKLPGVFPHYRMTELILRSMLRHIVDYPYRKNHFIYVPLSDRYYSRAKFLPAFRQLNNSTIKEKNDPSYDVLIHLLGFVYGVESPIHGVRYSPNDVAAMNKEGLVISNNSSTSIFNRLSDDQLSVINIILEHQGEVVIYNLKQLKEFASKGAFFLQFYRHVMKLKSRALSSSELAELDQDYKTNLRLEGEEPKEEITNTTNTTDVIEDELSPEEYLENGEDKDSPEEYNKDPLKGEIFSKHSLPVKDTITNFASKIESKADYNVRDTDPEIDESTLPEEVKAENELAPDSISDITSELGLDDYIASLDKPAQKRAKKLLLRLETLPLNGKSLKEHIETAPRSLKKELIANEDTNFIDPETKTSAIFSFDQQYLENNFHTDLAKTLTSFMKQGFFVYNLTESKDITRIDSTTTYRVVFMSVHDGKQHVVSFTLPNVDKEGVFKDNGNDYRLIKQKIAVPIAKVSSTRVGLFSSYNKSTVERTGTRRSYKQFILKTLEALVRSEQIKPQYGHLTVDHTLLPLEYTAIAERYSKLTIGKYNLTFNFPERFDGLEESEVNHLKLLEVKYGVYLGKDNKGHPLFFSLSNFLIIAEDDELTSWKEITFLDLLKEVFPKESFSNLPYEYTLVTIISESYPVIFLLGLMHGLIPTLRHIRAKMRFVPSGKAVRLQPNELRIRFKNGSLVYNRYPLLNSFIISGLSWCNPERYNIEDFESEDTYFNILETKGISTNQIKGIKSFFALFIDPITKSLLEAMHEPTNVSDLLIRATEMLTTESHYPASSERNYRFRSFERFVSMVHNEIARSIATYDSDRTRNKTLNVNPKAVYQKIYADPAKTLVDTLNPIHEIKDVTKGSYAGIGGRTGRSFVINDRTYSPDSVGVISEATPDSGKVGMIFSTVMDPNIIDLYGRTIPHEEGEKITSAAKMMSVVGNLLPGLAQDD